MQKTILLVCSLLLLSTLSFAESDFLKEFNNKYNLIDEDIVNYTGEEINVKDFVYTKDIATFTFHEGIIHLIRYVDGRATSAIFLGRGNAQISIPSHAERHSLEIISKDSVVNEDFEVCIMRFSDDFDLKLKELFPSEMKAVKWKAFAKIKEAHSDVYFKPTIEDMYDNKFQQLRSIYERNEKGYFWIDFNRYNFTYDPNNPNEIEVSYEFENNDYYMTDAVVLPEGLTEDIPDTSLSFIDYPTTALEKYGSLTMGGLDGSKIIEADITMPIVINRDSLRFISMFLHDNLKLDSMFVGSEPLDFHRRKDFKAISAILPEYKYKNDTIEFTFFFHGDDYDNPLPYVADPKPVPHTLEFHIPKGYNYLMPGKGEMKEEDKYMVFTAAPQQPFDNFQFFGYATGFDTVSYPSGLGYDINIIKSTAYDKKMACYVSDDVYDSSVVRSFTVLSQFLGNPIGTFEMFVQPESLINMPGLAGIPQLNCYAESNLEFAGGFDMFTSEALAHQWFGHLMKPRSDREDWVRYAATQYLSLMTVQTKSNNYYYTNLLVRKDSLARLHDLRRNRPLSNGSRNTNMIMNNKGAWVFHMLRFMMFDTDNATDAKFRRFMYELSMLTNTKTFSNADVIRLAEKHYGDDLDWFFKQWLFDCDYPEYNVKYAFVNDGGHFVDVNVETKCDIPEFKMPVMMRVVDEAGNSRFHREMISGDTYSFRIGPLEAPPKEFVFNELFSVLSSDNVDKK